ncbi:PfkB family carbohydrate kinase [Rhizoctonia solani]|uniref:PfkB family carbohydrate kinase n=1 Tax=Rhizoctonia solani TaxID=456999 RepID=A0A8H8NNH3_9AGAM|nr:PfkB family carbohydrate kinase [Rhizoctonia solani]QRW16415.1 PfkB family carbohydrate kinase [Rhizoctonia solani]
MVATTPIAPNLPGANQAVSVAASGSAVEFAGSVGSDGAWLKEFLKERGVGTDLMLVHPGKPSGRAIIQTTPEGENAIFLFPGTNHASYPADSPALQPYHTHLLLQNEILLSDTVETLSAAYQQGIVSIFNPSPMLSPEELRLFPWEKLSILVVNQGEARSLLDALGKQNQKLADSEGKVILDALYALPTLSGLSGIVVTLGGSGAVASFSTPSRRETIQLPAAQVKVIDTTGAGDTFLGYLCGSLMRVSGKTWDISQLKEALKRSIVAASLSTERPGAMSSIPSNLEVETQLATYHSYQHGIKNWRSQAVSPNSNYHIAAASQVICSPVSLSEGTRMAYVRGYHNAHMGGPHAQAYPPANHYPQAYYQQQPQQPQPFPDNIRDPVAFHHMFNEQLSTLTFNSKAIIQHLGYISKLYANSPMAPVIAESIERQIHKVPAAIKLPPFYLLDSIAKNIGQPYISYFTNFIVRLFLDTYHAVDAPTRGKMEEMLVTWRTAQYGRELFGQNVQLAIERGVWGSGAADTRSGPGPSRQQTKPNINQVLLELDVTLSSKERMLAANPNDRETASHIDVLVQLRSLVQSRTASDEELAAILTQLRSLAKSSAAAQPLPPPPVPAPAPAPHYPYQQQQASAPPPAPAPTPASYYQKPPSHTSTPLAPAPAPSFDLAALLKTASAASTPTPPNPVETPKPPAAAPIIPSDLLKNLISAANDCEGETGRVWKTEDYDETILGVDIQLTAASIQRERPQMANLLYNRLPLQCKQCALRFPAGEAGKKSMEDHLDLHFKQNRKARENTGRGHSRSWFVSRNDWIHGARDAGESVTTVKAQAAAAEERLAKLRESYVVVPPGEEAKPALCPICKESIKSEYLEDDEEWVWRNAVNVKGQIYHATCFDEAGQVGSLASRLRLEMGATGGHSRSRSLTPERLPASPLTRSPGGTIRVAGVKRKAEDEVNVKIEPGLSPKRIAV